MAHAEALRARAAHLLLDQTLALQVRKRTQGILDRTIENHFC
ncbi:MAG: hypothetical protein OXG27_08335 [Chloroflexi bacterium]|nr:hypothetical protein [Chloroflexota bacterium]